MRSYILTVIVIFNDDQSLTSCSWATARAFCRDEIGVVMPPKLHANARPISRAFVNLSRTYHIMQYAYENIYIYIYINAAMYLESCGMFSTIGTRIEVHRMGAV